MGDLRTALLVPPVRDPSAFSADVFEFLSRSRGPVGGIGVEVTSSEVVTLA
jgi:hypothetical protein